MSISTHDLADQLAELRDHAASLEDEGKTLCPEAQEKLDELENLASEVTDFECGAPLIHENDWQDYCEDFARDVISGYSENEANWPYTYIDWDQAASSLKQDYHEVEYRGETYLARC